jgi:hypothetical protein
LKWALAGGSIAMVTPQNWLFQPRYVALRKQLLAGTTWNITVRLGEHAFESSAAAGAFAAMTILSNSTPKHKHSFCAVDVSAQRGDPPIYAERKAALLRGEETLMLHWLDQAEQMKNPGHVIRLDVDAPGELMSNYGRAWQGLVTGDDNRFVANFWEVDRWEHIWRPLQQAPKSTQFYTGRSDVIRWENGSGDLHNRSSAHNFPPKMTLGKTGVAIQRVSKISATIYSGDVFDDSVAPFIPLSEKDLPAIWAFCESEEFRPAVRAVNQSLKVVPGSINSVRFDLTHWKKVAAEKYPNGLPDPESDDPTQWLFNGRPEESTAPLQVAVARLLGYHWPAELEAKMRLSTRARTMVKRCDELAKFTTANGFLFIPSVRGEDPAGEWLLALLGACGLKPDKVRDLTGGVDLDSWFHNSFFEEHLKLFHQRPFIWHIWDGRRRDGFHALVNYHKLAEGNGVGRQLLENLTYSYLGEWITRQREGVKRGEGGAEDRLTAALELQKRLIAIIEGEPPFDIFIRWKPIEEQPIGWEPDINDGVRLNIRPFMAQDIPGGRKGAGILRWKPNIKWGKDRGKESSRPKEQYPWFWKDGEFTSERVNDIHLTSEEKIQARQKLMEK